MYPAGVPDIRTRRVSLPDGLTLRVAESGDASAPPILLLHGWGASLYMWRAWFQPLARAGYRVIAVDLPGHGLSDKPTQPGFYALPRQVQVLRDLFDAERLHGAPVVAQSMAGTLALALALESEGLVSRLALVNPAAFGRAPLQSLASLFSPSKLDRIFGWTVPRWMITRAHRLAYADSSRVTSRDVDEYWAPSQDPDFARAMRALLREFTWSRQPAEKMAVRIRSLAHRPLVILSGRDYLIRDARPYVAELQRAGASLEVLHVPHGGHAVNEEMPDIVLARVMQFLGDD